MVQEISIEINQNVGKKKTASKNCKFERTLIDAVDEVFSSLFGSQKDNVYSYLHKCYNINKQEIPYIVEDFADALEEIFGQSAKLIEIEIMKAMHASSRNLKFTPKPKEPAFVSYIKAKRDL